MVLILVSDIYMYDGSYDVSVPLRGLWFLSKCQFNYDGDGYCRFRPLAGIMVLIG